MNIQCFCLRVGFHHLLSHVVPQAFYYLYICIYLCKEGYVHLSVSARRSQKRMSHPTELEFHAVMSHLTRVLGVKLSSSTRAITTLDLLTISPAPQRLF